MSDRPADPTPLDGAPAETVSPTTAEPPGGRIALGVMIAIWVIGIASELRHRIVLSSDTINNYVHVWYVSDQLWTHHAVPLHMPILGHGQAYTYPYGFLPWFGAALLRPALGDWGVTLGLVTGAVAMVAATFFAFPELRRGWWAAAVLANPAIVQAPLFGQMTFEWAAALLLAGIGCWRRDRRVWAVVLVGLAQATHAAVVLPIAALTVLCWLPYEKDRRKLIGCYALSCAIALPAVWFVVTSPTTGDATLRDVVVNFFSTIGARCLVVLAPVAYLWIQRRGLRLAPAALGLAVAVNLVLAIPMKVPRAAGALVRQPAAQSMDAYLRSAAFRPGLTYRVLRNGDFKLGLYRLLQHGGRLDSELFPESMAIRSFSSAGDYAQVLCDRKVDRVLAFRSYDLARRTNEHDLLRQLDAAWPQALGSGDHRVAAHRIGGTKTLDVYAIDRRGCPSG